MQNMIRAFVLASAVAANVVSAAYAHQPVYDQSIDCAKVKKHGGNNYEMGQCAGRARQEVDTQLNLVYGQLRAELKGTEDEKSLVEAQQAWIAWRDKEADICARSSGFSPMGSGYGMVSASCLSALTAERTKSLRSYLRDIKSR
jgi:uncharacterized protein YecT (DUF1311 family)